MSVSEQQFKQAMSQFPSGVTIITLRESDRVKGMTASAFMSVSLDPPLILESVTKGSSMHSALMKTERFGVSILSEHQVPVSNYYAGWGVEGFEPEHVELNAIPTIKDSLTRAACRVLSRVDAGDHTLFIAEVEAVETQEGVGEALIYYKRDYCVPRSMQLASMRTPSGQNKTLSSPIVKAEEN